MVKVQRPGVRCTIERDLELLHILAAILERSIAEIAHLLVRWAWSHQFDRSITAELDFIIEGEQRRAFRAKLRGHTRAIALPQGLQGRVDASRC